MVTENFLTGRVHAREDAAAFKRFGEKYGAPWTPTTLFLDPAGVERHRIEGFLPTGDFIAQLTLGLGHLAFHAARWGEAEGRFQEVVSRFPESDAAPEAQYWAGVSRYKASGDGKALADTALAFEQRYQNSVWAKKSSVWKAPA